MIGITAGVQELPIAHKFVHIFCQPLTRTAYSCSIELLFDRKWDMKDARVRIESKRIDAEG